MSLIAATVFSVLMGASPVARAAEGPDFEKHKAEAVTEIDQRIGKLQQMKSCISGASNHEAVKACRADMKEFREEQRSERIEKRKEALENRLNKLNERKNKK